MKHTLTILAIFAAFGAMGQSKFTPPYVTHAGMEDHVTRFEYKNGKWYAAPDTNWRDKYFELRDSINMANLKPVQPIFYSDSIGNIYIFVNGSFRKVETSKKNPS